MNDNFSGNNNNNNNRNNRRTFKCNYCNKTGHTEQYCYKKQNDERVNKTTDETVEEDEKEVSLVTKDELTLSSFEESDYSLWIGDSGASGHMTGTDKYLVNCKRIEEPIDIADEGKMLATKIGDIPVMTRNRNGKA